MKNNPNRRDFPTDTEIRTSNNINFKVIIPSTRDKTIVVKKTTFEKRVKDLTNRLTRMFNGATVDYQFGTYMFDGKTVKENVAIISIFTTEEMYNKYDVEVQKLLVEKKHAWGQDSMGFEYQEKLIFI